MTKLNSQFPLQNQTILISGATGGIGQALADKLYTMGAQLILLGTKQTKFDTLLDKLDKKFTEQLLAPITIQFDFKTAIYDHYIELKDYVLNYTKHIDALILNAAQLGPLSPIRYYSPDKWLEVIHVNLNAHFLLTQVMIELLQISGAGKIIATLDKTAFSETAYWGAYKISKCGLKEMINILADELEYLNIGCHTVELGKVETDLRRAAFLGEDKMSWVKAEDAIQPFLDILTENRDKEKSIPIRKKVLTPIITG